MEVNNKKGNNMKLPTIHLFFLLSVWSATWAQESPSLLVDKFDRSVSYRTNVCERQLSVWNNTLALPDALRGLNLTVVITNYQKPDEVQFFTLSDGKIKADDPGLFAVILDEVAHRAGFAWRHSFAAVPPLTTATDGNKTWTDILTWGTEVFDISMEKWGMSTQRMALGISFPTGWWDSSIVLAEQFDPSQKKREVDLWSFLKPFETSVWGMIVGTVVIAGLIYWFLDYLNAFADERALEEKPVASIFLAALTFTGHFELRPNTLAAQIMAFSFTFWALIVGAAYTANMASFLVSPVVSVFKVPTIEVAAQSGAALCVQKNAVIQSILNEEFPGLNLVPKEGEANIYNSLRVDPARGGCAAAAHQYNTFRIYQRSKEVNYDCTITSEKYIVKIVPAGMATTVDTGGSSEAKCTSLISHVLDYHLETMRADGFIEKAFNNHLNKIGTIECIEKVDQSGGIDFEETFSLGLPDVGGIFILHAIASALAIAIALIEFKRRPQHLRRKFKSLWAVFGIPIGNKKRANLNNDKNDSDPTNASSTFVGNELPYRSSFSAQKQ